MIGSLSTEEKLHFFHEVIGAYTARSLQRTQATLQRYLPETIQRMRDVQFTRKCLQQRLLPEIISCWKRRKADQDKKNKVCGHLCNPLACIPIDETTHSLLLGDLLDPKGSHGQGRLLLDAFLERLKVPTPKDGDWMISIGGSGVDICIWRTTPASVVVIENKSNWAVDQPNQLYRYWYENIQKRDPLLNYSIAENKQAFQVIYLPPAAGKQPAQHSLQRPQYLDELGLPKTLAEAGVTVKVLTFRDDIAAWLNYCDQLIAPTNFRLRAYLQFYRELWN